MTDLLTKKFGIFRFTEKRGGWEWGGWSDNFQFGSQVATQFLDGQETGADSNSLVNLHNNGAGRVVSKIALITTSGTLLRNMIEYNAQYCNAFDFLGSQKDNAANV